MAFLDRATAVGLLLSAAALATPLAHAAPPGLTVPDLNAILPASSTQIILKTLGIVMNHRPYQGAAPRGITGFDFGIEATLVHLPAGFLSALSGASGTEGSSESPSGGSEMGALPSIKLQLHKGLGPRADLGLSGLYLRGTYIWGLGLKFTVAEPAEGPAWAMRFSYSETHIATSSLGLPAIPIPIDGVESTSAYIDVNTRTVSAQLLASKAFSFAEPYIGIGADWVTGQIEVPVKIAVLDESQTLYSEPSSAYQFQAFTGVVFRIVPVGIRIAMEGSYSTSGMHSLGTVVGFAF